jgi:hypothetical protein
VLTQPVELAPMPETNFKVKKGKEKAKLIAPQEGKI